MGTAYAGESTSMGCCGNPHDRTPPDTAPFVVALNNLDGFVYLMADGGVSIRSEGQNIFIGADGEAGLGTVTSVGLTSNSTGALTVTGSSITEAGSFSLTVDAALVSIAALTTAADQLIYTTASDTYATTSLTAAARNLLDDASVSAMRTTLGATTIGSNLFTLSNPGAVTFPRYNADNTVTARSAANLRSDLSLVIGTNVQAWSADLDSFATYAEWAGSGLILPGSLSVTDEINATSLVTGNGLGIEQLNAGNISTGTVPSARVVGGYTNITGIGTITTGTWNATAIGAIYGGTGLTSYSGGDLIYASGTNTLARLAVDGNSTRYLANTGSGNAPQWNQVSLTTGVSGTLPFGSARISTGNTLWVDGEFGSNTTGTRERADLPYETINGAMAEANFGDTIMIRSGTYNEQVVVGSSSVNLQGVGFPTITIQITDDGESATCSIRDINIQCSGDALVISHSESNISLDRVNIYSDGGYGVNQSDGTLKLTNVRIDTMQTALNNPIIKTGGTLVLKDCVLLAESTRDSINATTAQNVVAYASYANKAVDSDVTITITNGLTVDADVA